MMLQMLNPEFRFSSLKKITPEWMKQHQYRVLMMDIDNTLLPRNSTIVPAQHLEWLQKMQGNGIKIVLASNNGGKRIAEIKSQLSDNGLCIPVLTWAGKPFPRAYADAIRLLKKSFPEMDTDMVQASSPANNVITNKGSDSNSISDIRKCTGHILAAGDQLFTDVLGAHWYNLPVVLLRPLSNNDFIGTKLLRILERCVSWYMDKQGSFPKEDSMDIV